MIHTSSNNHLADISKNGDLISRAGAIDLLRKRLIETANNNVGFTCDAGQVFEDASERIRDWIDELPSAQPESCKRVFEKIVVEYPDPSICTYKEYKGKPYFSIQYRENGDRFVGFGTYNPEVLTQYLKTYFMPSVQPEPEEFEWCTDCKEYDQTKHCCHRWTKVIRQTVAEIKAEQPERKPYHEEWISALRTQPEQKVGKWIPCDVDSRGMTNMFVCSKCSSFTSLPILRYANAMEYDYCPHCGSYNGGDEE